MASKFSPLEQCQFYCYQIGRDLESLCILLTKCQFLSFLISVYSEPWMGFQLQTCSFIYCCNTCSCVSSCWNTRYSSRCLVALLGQLRESLKIMAVDITSLHLLCSRLFRQGLHLVGMHVNKCRPCLVYNLVDLWQAELVYVVPSPQNHALYSVPC